MPFHDSSSPDRVVRDLVTRADRARRGRDRRALLARLAPFTGAGLLLISLAGRFLRWPSPLTVGLMVAVIAGVALYTWITLRNRDTADAIAARVDRDAALGGELRSAHWFAAAPDRSDWATFHLERAADRASRVSWATLYPSTPNRKAWAAAAVCAIAAAILPISLPAPQAAVKTASGDPAAPVAPGDDEAALLRAKLEALLANIKDGKMGEAAAAADLEMLKKLMAAVDPALQKKLDELLKKQPLGKDAQTKTKNLDEEDLAERGDNADSAAGLPEDVRWALEDLAARLANSNANRQTNESNPAASQQTGEKGRGSSQAQNADAQAGEQSVQMVREAAADPGAAKMMPGGGGMMGGDSRAGAGGNEGNKTGSATPEQIALALRKELIEANTDTTGENVNKEDIRRKTEQGKSTIGFTRVAAPSSYDASRATAPPVVPEARRSLLQRYFIRR